AFRSILLALKALVLNLLSLAATFGVMTWFWQQGHGSDLVFGISATGAISFWLPLMMFAFLFGLSMDYEVFILTRVREEYERTCCGSSRRGCAHEGRGADGLRGGDARRRLGAAPRRRRGRRLAAVRSRPGRDRGGSDRGRARRRCICARARRASCRARLGRLRHRRLRRRALDDGARRRDRRHRLPRNDAAAPVARARAAQPWGFSPRASSSTNWLMRRARVSGRFASWIR